MIENINALKELCESTSFELFKISEEEYNTGPGPDNALGKSKKQILGYLIDMAVIHHQRMIRCQFEDNPQIIHDTESWLKCGYYDTMNSRKLILFWKKYNEFIIDLIEHMDAEALQKTCDVGASESIPLEYLIGTYVGRIHYLVKKILLHIPQTIPTWTDKSPKLDG